MMGDDKPAPTVLAISSQVAYGPVGNSAAVPAMQSLGITALAVPTVLMSNHPGHGGAVRLPIDAGFLSAAIERMASAGWLDQLDAVLTGYFTDAAQVEAVGQALAKLKSGRPNVLYLCDPVLGDDHTGLYVAQTVATAIASRLVPLADVIAPNRFELAWLSGREVNDAQQAAAAARGLASTTLATSIPAGGGRLATMLIDSGGSWQVETPRRQRVPQGTGDLLAGLFLAHLSLGRSGRHALAASVGAVEAILDVSEVSDTLDLAAGLAGITAVRPLPVRRLGNGRVRVAGVDGCKGGWLAVEWDGSRRGGPVGSVLASFQDVLALNAQVIAVDMPIGFPDRVGSGGRDCDREARRLLGARRSSVFPAPARPALAASGYREALALNRKSSITGAIGTPIACFMLFAKMREIDALMTPVLQERVFEVHPELSFLVMNGEAPVIAPKRRPEGAAARRKLLEAAGFPLSRLKPPSAPRRLWSSDDLIDACALAWSARRIRDGEQLTVPRHPRRDGRGLRMEINA